MKVAENNPGIQEDLLEERTFKGSESEESFKVLSIDSPDKWKNAEENTSDFTIRSGEGSYSLSLKGVSLADWEKVEDEVKFPSHLTDKKDSEKSNAELEEQNKLSMHRKVLIFEKSFGNIPGETVDEKIEFLKDRVPGEVDSISDFIGRELCNFKDGARLSSYILLIEASKTPVNLSSFDNWSTASETKYIFRFQRVYDEFITEIPLKGVSAKDKESIEIETKFPEPPMLPKRLANGRFDPSQLEPNTEETSYVTACKLNGRKRMVMYMDKCLSFELPGTTVEEKYEWLSGRLVGDVIRLQEFINRRILSYEEQYDFFTSVLGQLS